MGVKGVNSCHPAPQGRRVILCGCTKVVLSAGDSSPSQPVLSDVEASLKKTGGSTRWA